MLDGVIEFLTCSLWKLILGLQHPLGPEHLQPLVVAVAGEPGQVDGGEGS